MRRREGRSSQAGLGQADMERTTNRIDGIGATIRRLQLRLHSLHSLDKQGRKDPHRILNPMGAGENGYENLRRFHMADVQWQGSLTQAS